LQETGRRRYGGATRLFPEDAPVPKTKTPQRFVHKRLLTDEERGLWRLFVTLNFAINRALDNELRLESGLTLPEFEVLFQLTSAEDNRVRMRELADHLLFTRSGVTRLIDRLEDAGYVERDYCDQDGRGVFASLTKAGFETFEAATVDYVAALRHHFLNRLRGDLGEMRRLLRRLESDELL
jgi:DNA-binding MarR family transcriptional regulator